MTLPDTLIEIDCPTCEIAAYIDGELSPLEQAELENHLTGCSVCSTELNHQKAFLFALNSSLENEKEFELPKNFTKAIVVNAESRVSGLRLPKERFTAIFICAALFLFVLFALGGDAGLLLRASGKIIEKVIAVGALVLHFVYSISMTGTVIAKSLFSQPVFGLGVLAALVAGLAGSAVFILRRLWGREKHVQES